MTVDKLHHVETRARLDRYVMAFTPFTPVLGLVRSLLALGTLLTLAATPTDQLFFRSETFPSGATCNAATSWLSLFCVGADAGLLEGAKWLAIVVLASVVAGLAPAITAGPHWWVTWSLMTSSTAVDGGEHLSANVTLILLPLALLDRRRWHWGPDRTYRRRTPWVRFAAYACLALWSVQVMGVYFQASIAKFAVLEWSDGTALWYWMQNPTFGPRGVVGELVRGALQLLPVSVLATYGTLVLQLSLVVGAFFRRHFRTGLLLAAVLFHLVIAALMGLWSFSIAMIAADLLLLLRPHESRHLSAAFHAARVFRGWPS